MKEGRTFENKLSYRIFGPRIFQMIARDRLNR